VIVLSAVAIARRNWGSLGFLVTAFVGVGLTGAVAYLFAVPWVTYPFTVTDLGYGLLLATSGWLLVWRTPRGQLLTVVFLLWGVTSLALFVVPNPVGADVLRLREFSLPLVTLALLLTGCQRRLLGPASIGLALASTATIYQPAYAGLLTGGNGRIELWSPALTFLRTQPTVGFRIEVVPTAGHWEAYYFPRDGYALARGWYRQLDLSVNQVLYSRSLTPLQYRRWLDARAVRFVLVSHRVGLDGSGARAEARLLSSDRSGLHEVLNRDGWTIYAVPRPTPILSGRSRSALIYFGHDRVRGWVASAGRYRLLVRYAPVWANSPSVCVLPGRDGMSTLVASRAGTFSLDSSIDGLTDGPGTCPSGRTTSGGGEARPPRVSPDHSTESAVEPRAAST